MNKSCVPQTFLLIAIAFLFPSLSARMACAQTPLTLGAPVSQTLNFNDDTFSAYADITTQTWFIISIAKTNANWTTSFFERKNEMPDDITYDGADLNRQDDHVLMFKEISAGRYYFLFRSIVSFGYPESFTLMAYDTATLPRLLPDVTVTACLHSARATQVCQFTGEGAQEGTILFHPLDAGDNVLRVSLNDLPTAEFYDYLMQGSGDLSLNIPSMTRGTYLVTAQTTAAGPMPHTLTLFQSSDDLIRYDYDTMDHLTNIQYSTGFRQAFAYDTHGNRLSQASEAPAAPANLFATPARRSISLIWSEAAGAALYTLWRAADTNPASAQVLSANLGTNAYTDSSVTPGSPYYYWVQAQNAIGASPFSLYINAVPLGSSPLSWLLLLLLQ